MWKFKLFQYKDPLHYPCMIYWLPSTEGYIEDYMVSTGLVPCFNSREITPRDISYVSASYEMRPVELVEANVSPNWRFDKETQIEAFTLKRENSGIIFLKSHEEKAVKEKIGVDLKPLGIDKKDKKVYSYLLHIKNGRDWKGRLGEIEKEDIYKTGGWIFDRVIRTEFIGEDNWRERIEKEIEMEPEQGMIWVITQTLGFVYSIDNLPVQLWLPEVLGVKVDGEIKGNTIKIKVSSEKEDAEIGCFIPEGMAIEKVITGGREEVFKVGFIGNTQIIIVPVKRGETEITCMLKKKGEKLSSLQKVNYTGTTPGKQMNIKIEFPGDWQDKLFTIEIEKGGNIYWVKTDKVSSLNYETNITLPVQMEQGEYNLIITDITGENRKVEVVNFPSGKSTIYLPPALVPLPTEEEVKQVNMNKKGNIEVSGYGWQYSKGAGGVEVKPEELKIDIYSLPMYESHWNTITAGIEMKVERYLKIKVKGNFDYFNKFQCFKQHSPRWDNPNYFVGLIIDFHTKDGYTKRSACGLGIIKDNRTSKVPSIWGSKDVPTGYYSLSDIVLREDKSEEEMWIDLKQIGADDNWDGKIWIAPVMETIAPDRKISIEIIDTSSKEPEEEIRKGISLKQSVEKKEFKVPKIESSITIDGKLDEDVWGKALKLDDFSLLTFPSIKAYQKTQADIFHDGKNIYLGFLCEEKEKDVLDIENGNVWNNDSIEFLFEISGVNGYFHGIIDAKGRIYQETEKNGEKKVETIPGFDFAVNEGKGYYSIEIRFPLRVINLDKVEGKKVGFNLMRNRLFKGDRQYFTLVPGSSYFVKDKYFLIF